MKKPKIKPPPNWEDTPQSFENFERLAKGLMAVKKTEIDKRNVEQKRKPKRKTRSDR